MKKLLNRILNYLTDSGEHILIEHAPCADGVHHTSYQLVRSPRSKVFTTFPESNFKLTPPEWQEETRRQMAEQGFKLHLQGT